MNIDYDLILVRYGEIGLKKKPTRQNFENILIKNIKKSLKKKEIKNEITKTYGRIYVKTNQIKKTTDILKKIFGITSISPAIKTKTDIKNLKKIAVEISKKHLTKKDTFALRVRREGKHDFTSQDIAIILGDEIRKKTKASVDLTKPDFTLFIEIRDDKTYFFTDKIKSVAGLPIGSQGKILAVIENKISLLACWYMMHRGCEIVFLKNSVFPKKENKSFIDKWYLDSKIIEIEKDKDFFKKINDLSQKNNCDAVVTNHYFLENNSNILDEIKSFKKQIAIPVLHPLISFNEKQIKDKLELIV